MRIKRPISLEDIDVENGTLWFYDDSRGKWLSVTNTTLSAGKKNRAKNIYLRFPNEQANIYNVPRNMTAISII